MKSVHTILSSLLAGMMMFSLAACTASGTGASGSDSSAVQTDAVPQGLSLIHISEPTRP